MILISGGEQGNLLVHGGVPNQQYVEGPVIVMVI